LPPRRRRSWLRIAIETADLPHALLTIVQAPHLLLGVYQLAHSAASPSSVELALIPGTRGLRPIPTSPLP
jgi:hypothetical protein